MRRRFSLPIFLIIAFLIGTLAVSVRVQRVEASETIYIRADGSIDPPTANITSADNVTYTFIGNINESIVLERNNIVVDGAGYMLQGSGSGNGFNWSGINNVTIKHTNIKNFYYSIWLDYSSNNSISGNNITNNIAYNAIGIWLSSSSSNSISGNDITANNAVGIRLDYSYNNRVFHNNLISKTNQVYPSDSVNIWDDGYPSGGNFWSNYTGVDTDLDGIGDSHHVIASNNTDYYPLMGMFSSFNTSLGDYVNVVSNSTVGQFSYFEESKTITLYASNMTVNQTHGFCRVCIPHSLINATEGSIEVIINEGLTTVLNLNNTLYDNGTHRWIYFEYEHSTLEIIIIPEFSSLIMLTLFLIATFPVALIYKRKRSI